MGNLLVPEEKKSGWNITGKIRHDVTFFTNKSPNCILFYLGSRDKSRREWTLLSQLVIPGRGRREILRTFELC